MERGERERGRKGGRRTGFKSYNQTRDVGRGMTFLRFNGDCVEGGYRNKLNWIRALLGLLLLRKKNFFEKPFPFISSPRPPGGGEVIIRGKKQSPGVGLGRGGGAKNFPPLSDFGTFFLGGDTVVDNE